MGTILKNQLDGKRGDFLPKNRLCQSFPRSPLPLARPSFDVPLLPPKSPFLPSSSSLSVCSITMGEGHFFTFWSAKMAREKRPNFVRTLLHGIQIHQETLINFCLIHQPATLATFVATFFASPSSSSFRGSFSLPTSTRVPSVSFA